MTPPMYKRVRDVFVEAKLTEGFSIQTLVWTDTGKGTDRFVVFRPSGGSAIDGTVSSDYYVMVDIISSVGVQQYQKADDTVNAIAQFVKDNPIHSCLGQITNLGGIPAPILTTDKRLVYRLMFACLYGD